MQTVQGALLLLLGVLLAASAAGTVLEPVLLVVGDVTTTAARVLHQSGTGSTFTAQYTLHSGDDDEERAGAIELDAAKPAVLVLDGLAPGTAYRLRIDGGDGVLAEATWRTFSDTKRGKGSVELAVLSCNRYNEDGDLTHWERLAASDRATSRRDGTVHLGDQIYADVLADAARQNTSMTKDDFVALFRAMYVRTWATPTMQRVLRHGPHWMLPDDHDIINNLDADLDTPILHNLLAAGRQTFFEYQLALLKPTDDAEASPAAYFSKRIGDLALYFLDTRMERTFAHEPAHPLLGSAQWHDFQTTIAAWTKDKSIRRVIVFSSVPIFGGTAAAQIVYAMEQERLLTHPDLIGETQLLLDTLAPLAAQDRVVLVGGDIHMYMQSLICLGGTDDTCIRQVATSGMSIGSTVLNSPKIYVFVLLWYYILPVQVGEWVAMHTDGFLGKNFVVLRHTPGSAELEVMPFLDQDMSMLASALQTLFELVPHSLILALTIMSIVSARLIIAP